MATNAQVRYALHRGATSICLDKDNVGSEDVLAALKFHGKQLKTVIVDTDKNMPKDVQEFLEKNITQLRIG